MQTKYVRLPFALLAGGLLVVGCVLLLGPSPSTAASTPAQSPVAPQALPTPWLSDDDVADAPFSAPNIWPPPAVDGLIAPGEYAHAGKVTFPGYAGDVEVFIRQNAITLYVAFDSPDTTPYPFGSGGGTGPAFQVFLDTNNDGGTAPQTDDYKLSLDKGGGLWEQQGNGSGNWTGAGAGSGWIAAVYTATWGWQAEFAISFSKLGITAGVPSSIGLGLAEVWTPSWPYDWYWPQGGFYLNPDTWGDLTSSSNWSTFYWKPGPWEDYAPSGMPDFDQRQDHWVYPSTPISTHCGPVAMANSLWWFDSKFETPDHPPLPVSDTYRLVWRYAAPDDHDPQNVIPLVDDLANNYFGTNQGIMGTHVISMFFGTHQYLRDHGLWDDYIVTLVISPSFEWVADEVMRSEDVILLLGFYEEIAPDYWQRVGGHYVNVAGVQVTPTGQIAFSDPFVDNAEIVGAGRVLSGTLLPHYPPHPGPDSGAHNDAGNVSHDVYTVTQTSSPGGVWGPEDYPWGLFEPWFFSPEPVNPHPEIPTAPYAPGPPIQVEVEFALTVSPLDWKASGYWKGDFPSGNWSYFEDYAVNGVPDFDQKQDNWVGPPFGNWTFCGPVAAANSLWWFDSKYEPSPVGPPIPPPYQPITYNDNYPLVQSYDPAGLWDDHDPLNVDDPATPWPPGGEFVEDLATWVDTDGVASGASHAGTIITDLYTGIEQYIAHQGLRQGYVITMVKSPDFWWVAEEVERSEDVILLLGFWQFQGQDGWVRLGGHYVTLPGVDKQGGFVAFSDPWFNRIEQTWPYAGIGTLAGWPSYLGRVANGWLVPHIPIPGHPVTYHNDAGNVSHDVYNVVGTDSPGGVWGPEEYVNFWGPDIENFWGQNGQDDVPTPTGDPVQTEVDWAVAVSPVADLWVTKTVTATVVVPGEWVTFTIAFTNVGHDAENVVIYDVLPSGLTNASYTYTLNYIGTLVGYDTYTWTVGTLRWMQGGIITITAQVDPTITDTQRIITNTVQITTTTQEQYQVPEMPNSGSAILTVQTADVEIVKSSHPLTLTAGQWLTYTLVYTNSGPATAASTVITDLLHHWLTTASYTYTNDYGVVVTSSDTYVWQAGSIPAGRGGLITVTAQVSPSLSGGGMLTNDAQIATDTPESDATNNDSSTSNTVGNYGVEVTPISVTVSGGLSETVCFTLYITNTGSMTDTFNITHTFPISWNLAFTPSLQLGSEKSTDVPVCITIPGEANWGDVQTGTVTITSQGDVSKSAVVDVTVEVRYKIYLPVIMKNY